MRQGLPLACSSLSGLDSLASELQGWSSYSTFTVLELQARTKTPAFPPHGFCRLRRWFSYLHGKVFTDQVISQHGRSFVKSRMAMTSGVDKLQTLLPWRHHLGACGRLGCSSQDLGRPSSWAGCFRCQTRFLPAHGLPWEIFHQWLLLPQAPVFQPRLKRPVYITLISL